MRRAFTLIELLVVVAVIGILAGILLPVLSGAKAKGQKIICLNNQRQLVLTTFLYAGDHDDAFPQNLGVAETQQTVADGTYLNWVNNVMDWSLSPDNTNEFLVTAGDFGQYLVGGGSVYHCPADYTLSQDQQNAGWERRTRSISMNAMVGNAGAFTRSGFNTNNPHYTQFFRLNQVPEPSEIFVFIEEHPDSIRDGYFLNRHYSRQWMDLPASYHQGAANLAFVDGHVESHTWSEGSTRPPAQAYAVDLPFRLEREELEDYYWLMSRTSVRSGEY